MVLISPPTSHRDSAVNAQTHAASVDTNSNVIPSDAETEDEDGDDNWSVPDLLLVDKLSCAIVEKSNQKTSNSPWGLGKYIPGLDTRVFTPQVEENELESPACEPNKHHKSPPEESQVFLLTKTEDETSQDTTYQLDPNAL